MGSSMPDTNHKVVIVDPLAQTWSVCSLEESQREDGNTVATATTARAIRVVRSTRRPNCSRIPMRILNEGVLRDLLPLLKRHNRCPDFNVSASLLVVLQFGHSSDLAGIEGRGA